MQKIAFILLIGYCFSCNSSYTSSNQSDYNFPYNLDEPKNEFKLSRNLSEISALSLAKDASQLLAVNDEEGKVFFINKQTGEIEKELAFEKKGDFEGIEMVNGIIYAMKSNGSIYEIQDQENGKPSVEEYNTFLKTDDDVEGLGYDHNSNQLLLSCKKQSKKNRKYKDQRLVFGFDLATKQLQKNPVRTIHQDSLYNFIVEKTNTNFLIRKALSKSFAPSALAVHPLSGDWYLLSSIGKMMLVLDKIGNIRHIEKLNPNLMKQPEGICFDPNGTLYISSEGQGGAAKILVYKPLKVSKLK